MTLVPLVTDDQAPPEVRAVVRRHARDAQDRPHQQHLARRSHATRSSCR